MPTPTGSSSEVLRAVNTRSGIVASTVMPLPSARQQSRCCTPCAVRTLVCPSDAAFAGISSARSAGSPSSISVVPSAARRHT